MAESQPQRNLNETFQPPVLHYSLSSDVGFYDQPRGGYRYRGTGNRSRRHNFGAPSGRIDAQTFHFQENFDSPRPYFARRQGLGQRGALQGQVQGQGYRQGFASRGGRYLHAGTFLQPGGHEHEHGTSRLRQQLSLDQSFDPTQRHMQSPSPSRIEPNLQHYAQKFQEGDLGPIQSQQQQQIYSNTSSVSHNRQQMPQPQLISYHSDSIVQYREPDLQLMKSGCIILPPPPPPPRQPQNPIESPSNATCSIKFGDSIRKIGLELKPLPLSRSDTPDELKSQDEERPMCIVCCEELYEIAVGQCNHTLLCAMCAVRMRIFYRYIQCPLCKADNPDLICTQWKSSVKPYKELRKIAQQDEIPGLPFMKLELGETGRGRESSSRSYVQQMRDKLSRLGQRSCPCCAQVTAFNSFKDLSMHLMAYHGCYYCFVCQKAKRQFPCEIELFCKDMLAKHLETHPKCEFCNGLRYFSVREQKAHYQEEHYQCHICERMGLPDMWLEDVDDLLNHMRANHFTCSQCSDTVGFSTADELNAHQQAMHNAASSHFNVGVDPGRNELRIQLRGGREENIDQVRDNLVMLLNYFREMFGTGEHNGFMHSIEDVMQQFQMQVGLDDQANVDTGNLWGVLIPPPQPPGAQALNSVPFSSLLDSMGNTWGVPSEDESSQNYESPLDD
eukprot:TRINITY_DN44972_c0_g1_i1.p1 TRINITY_DN44972_c0_g1~~TRINITY_DN44972_c0_g1_i1.p1  ORF type:complete len:671 (-),score=46.10 TRINITY_DN44972_c0_g1_i1:840-2852(-)